MDLSVEAFGSLGPDLAAALSDQRVWVSLLTVLVFGAVLLILGTAIGHRLGVLDQDTPDGEILGVGLGIGSLVAAAVWASVVSGARSSFLPIAVALVVAVAIAPRGRDAPKAFTALSAGDPTARRSLVRPIGGAAAIGGAAFVVIVGLLYGATMAPSPRDGVQPVEFMDEAYYSILSRDLASTGTETIYSPSGFDELPGHPTQTWYHWGELWLTGAAIRVFSLDPLLARHYVVLPLLLLAAVALTGTLVRRAIRSRSRSAFALGALSCLFLAPVPLDGNFFTTWATGMLFGITLYGLAAVIVLLLLVLISRDPRLSFQPSSALFFGTCAASLLPAHIVIAILAAAGAAGAAIFHASAARIQTGSFPSVNLAWRRFIGATLIVTVGTAVWGLATGHGIGASGLSPAVPPFNETWRLAMAFTGVGALSFLSIPIVWALAVRNRERAAASAMVGVMALVAFGALAWGARLGDFTMFHVFFGAIAAFATPAAAVAVALLWQRLKSRQRPLALAILVLCAVQIEAGVFTGVLRLKQFGPHAYDPIPTAVLSEIAQLPPDAKLAYFCRPLEEVAVWDPRLLGIEAHTGRRVVPMCFQANPLAQLTGGDSSPSIVSPLFESTPQAELYPNWLSEPSRDLVAAFLARNGVRYLYVDEVHPNAQELDGLPLLTDGATQLLRLP